MGRGAGKTAACLRWLRERDDDGERWLVECNNDAQLSAMELHGRLYPQEGHGAICTPSYFLYLHGRRNLKLAVDNIELFPRHARFPVAPDLVTLTSVGGGNR
jgi:hypothetical protein